MTSGSAVSSSKVCSWPTDFAASGSSTGSASTPCARSTSDAPCLPNRRTSAVRSRAARSPIVATPKSRSAVAVDGPTPHSREIGSGARNAASSPGGTTTRPSGLRRSLPILATSFVAATPTEAVSSSSLADRRLDPARDRLAVAEQRPRAGDVQERLVDRDRLDERREAPQDRHDLAADALVLGAVTGTKTQSGHSRRAVRIGIAEWTPNMRASYDAARRRRGRWPRPCRRRPACRAAPGGRAARRPRRTRRGRRAGSSAARARSRAHCRPRRASSIGACGQAAPAAEGARNLPDSTAWRKALSISGATASAMYV